MATIVVRFGVAAMAILPTIYNATAVMSIVGVPLSAHASHASQPSACHPLSCYGNNSSGSLSLETHTQHKATKSTYTNKAHQPTQFVVPSRATCTTYQQSLTCEAHVDMSSRPRHLCQPRIDLDNEMGNGPMREKVHLPIAGPLDDK